MFSSNPFSSHSRAVRSHYFTSRQSSIQRRPQSNITKHSHHYLGALFVAFILFITTASKSTPPQSGRNYNQKMASSITIQALTSASRDEFTSHLGSIYEYSPWVAEKLFDSLSSGSTPPVTSLRELTNAMKQIVDSASHEEKLVLLRAHPDLAAKASTHLTADSKDEQSRAGLGSLTDDEMELFTANNEKYKSKFGFPFILAVRNATKYTVLSALTARVTNTPEVEFTAAMRQVHKIAWMRLLTKIELVNPKGFLTCHVLDTAMGCPAAKMRVILHRLSPVRELIGEFILNEDGRINGPALKGKNFQVGIYEYTFYVGDYFASKNVETTGMPFLDEVPVRFGIDDPEEHYHVPLLVSPYSFSTYRGS